jgi:hypothetical protein
VCLCAGEEVCVKGKEEWPGVGAVNWGYLQFFFFLSLSWSSYPNTACRADCQPAAYKSGLCCS